MFRRRGLGTPVPGEWRADHRVIFAATLRDSTNLWQIGISKADGWVAGPPQQLTSGTAIENLPSGTADGRIVFASFAVNVDIWSLETDHRKGFFSGEPLRLTQNTSLDAQPSMAASGHRLVFTTFRAGNGDDSPVTPSWWQEASRRTFSILSRGGA
jgi:hypothetical protein